MKTRLIPLFILLFCANIAAGALWPIKHDVRDWGAKADDAVIDTGPIQAALDQCTNGPIQVFIGPGTFLVKRTTKYTGVYGGALALVCWSNTVVRGAGAKATIVKMDSSENNNTAVFHIAENGRNVEFYDLAVDGNVVGRGITSTVESEGINYKGHRYGVIGNCEIRFNPADAIDFDSCHDMRIFNTYCWSNGSAGFHANGSTYVLITGCIVSSNGFYRTLEADGGVAGGGMDFHFGGENSATETTFYQNYGRNAIVESAAFYWNNCTFTTFGILTNLVSTNVGTAVINNCFFSGDNNSATSILLAPSPNLSSVQIAQSRFSGNSRGIYAPSGATSIIVNSCDFGNIGSHQIELAQPIAVVEVVNSSFLNNSSGGGIRSAQGNMVIVGNKFGAIFKPINLQAGSTNNIISGNKFLGPVDIVANHNTLSGNSFSAGLLTVAANDNRFYGNRFFQVQLNTGSSGNFFSGNTFASTITEQSGGVIQAQKWENNVDSLGDPMKNVPNIGGFLASGTNAHVCIVTNPTLPGTPGTIVAWESVTNFHGGRFWRPLYQ